MRFRLPMTDHGRGPMVVRKSAMESMIVRKERIDANCGSFITSCSFVLKIRYALAVV
jgi:hypothetical protein